MKKPSLNHRYRLVWSRVQKAFVAVAEHIKSHGKHAAAVRDNHQAVSTFRPVTVLALAKKTCFSMIVLAALFGASQNVYAQWEGVTNQHGQASYEYSGNHLDVNVKTHQLIANARSLSIAGHESVSVHQLSAQDTALFRSIGPSATEIFGSLTSNGNLFLINQNGVLFGKGAQINVGGLVASSADISDDDFLNKRYLFNRATNSADVVNAGVIKVADGGYVVLLGKEVSNSGTIQANNGSVIMASAASAELDFYGNGLVKAALSGDALEAVVEQSGVVQADGGAVQLATNSRSSAVNVSGITQANTLVKRNGVIRLEGGDNAKVSVSGTLNAKGEQAGTKGGTVAVTGEQVALMNGASVDASGVAGGGTVLVGGDYQGKNSEVYNARTTYIDQGAAINVDAKQTGDGGKAIVWADQTTRHYGGISAKGGQQSGDGGFVEVSGKQNLDFAGIVDVAAVNGAGGTVLFDPENIILNNTTQPSPGNNADGTPDVAFADAPVVGTTTIQINDVRGFSELYLQATNDITVANTLSMNNNNSVLLQANNDIHVNAEISTRGTGGITLNADNNVNLNGRLNSYGSGAINVTADADSSGAGDINLSQRVFARAGGINLTGANVLSATTAGLVQTQGLVGQDSSNINISASNAINMASNVISTGRNSTAGLDGVKGGDVNLTAAGAITVNNISAYGGNGGTGNTAGGGAGVITIQSTGAGDISTGTLNARNGAARGTGAGGAIGSINVTNTSGGIDTKNLYVHGNTNGHAGDISLTATSGNIAATGNVYASGGGTAAGSSSAGGNGGNINMDASGDVTVTSRVYAHGGSPRSGNTAAGGNAGNVSMSGANLSFDNVIYAYGGTARGLNQVGGDAGNISLNATGSISTKQVYAYGGSGGTGAGSNADGGNAGSITIASTGAGDINTASTINARNGAARGTGLAGNVGTINITNSDGNISTRNLETYGNLNGHGGNINVAAATGDVTVTGRVYSYGGTVNNGHTLAGRNGGNINISGVNRTITSRVNANGNTAKGVNQAGGHAGMVSITGAGTLNVADVYSRNGNATDAGAGGSVGSITLNGSTVTASSVVSTAGGRNGNGGDINLTSTTGDISVRGAYVQGGAANTNTAGGDAGNITVNSVGGFTVTDHLYAQGASGNGDNNNGGDAGTITVNAAGAISAKRVYAYGGTGGGNNALTNTAAGGNAGSVTLNSTAAGDITLTQDVNVRTGYSRGSAPGATAGSINLTNTDGSVITKNIRAEGQNHGDGSDVAINAGSTGDVTVNGVIYTYGDVNPTAATFVGVNAGDISITAANTTVTGAINTNGGRGRGVNQIGGDAGDVTINATGTISTQAIAANGGNAGTGAGSNAAGGSAGDINLTSTGTGDITAAAISARTGYSRGSATATGAGSVTIENDDGKLTATSISTRGQRRGVGGDVLAISAGDFNVGTVDARSSNLTGADDGAITIGTKTTGDTTVTNVLTSGRWLVYSGDPRNDAVGAFKATADFKEYNTNYGDALTDATGNGFVYRFAPVIANTLTGLASKVYDGNTTVNSIVGLTVNQGAAIDGDVVTLSSLTSATYDDRNVGTGKTLTSNAMSVTGATNGSAQVYGYQAGAATGNVGTITQRALTVTAVTDAKAYDGNVSSAGVPTLTSGSFVAGDTATFSQVFNNKNVGIGKTLLATSNIADGNGGNNYAVTYITDNTGVITESALSVAESQAEAAAENPRNQAGLGGLLDVSNQPQQFVSVFNVDATAAGGDGETEACLSEQEEKAQNPNTSIILNFGVNLPEGVKKTCI